MPNSVPYVVSASGNTDLERAPLQGSQISMMVFPIIPTEAKQELPNQPSVQFVHPSNLGEFDFTVNKTAAGFNVTIRPISGSPAKAAAAAPDPVAEPTQLTPPPEPTVSSAAFDPPVDPAPQPSTLENADSTASFDDFAARSTSDDFTPMTAEEIEGAQEYVPPSDYVTPVPAEEVIRNSVRDRRFGERTGSNGELKDRMEALFNLMAEAGASDLHLSAGMPPLVRKDGRIQKLECSEGVIHEEPMRDLLHSIMPQRNKDEFAERHDTDFAYEIPGLARFRSNIFMDRKGMGAVFRIIPSKMTTAEQLGLSKAIMGLTELSKGLVVVTGPTGSGKSTTLCAMVNNINQTREDHIITIEDPVEFVHENIKCLVNQREVHNHTMSFKDALRAALREDPDIVLVGEMRDLETISIAIETAETGHLVFGTLHTTTAVSTVDRIIDQFPADRQQQVRVMLSESLKGVVAQTLLPKKGGGRVAALEVLIVTPAISNLIREGKTFQIASAMQTGRALGMVMLNDALFDLVKNDIVEPRDAYLKSIDKTGFEAMLTKGGYKL